MKEKKRINELYNIAKLYYENSLSQDEIADLLKVSCATVSRALTEALGKGIVQIKVIDLLGINDKIAKQLEKKYNLLKVIVANVPINRNDIIKASIGREAANYIHEAINNNKTVGISWGTTLFEVAKYLKPKEVINLSIVELTGSTGNISSEFATSELARVFAKNFNGKRFVLQTPALVSSVSIKKAMVLDKNISRIIEMGKKVNIAIVGIGAVDITSPIYKAINFSKYEISNIISEKAIGDICFRFFNDNGKKLKLPFDDRIIGIDLNDFKKIKIRIGIAGGENKINPIKGALLGSLINILITDNFTAKSLI